MLPYLRKAFLNLAVAAAVCFLGAIPLASASGFYRGGDPMRGDGTVAIFCAGAVLFFLTLAVMGPLMRLGGSVGNSLARAESRPAPAIALGLIVCGTLCVVSSVWLAWSSHAASGPQALTNSMQQAMNRMQGQLPNGTSIHFDVPNVSFESGAGAGPMILTVMAFLLGTALIGLGVWSSIGAVPIGGHSTALYANSHVPKDPIPASDATRL